MSLSSIFSGQVRENILRKESVEAVLQFYAMLT